MSETNISGMKRRSRFESGAPPVEEPLQKRINLDVSLAAAKAAEISKELTAKIALVSSLLGSAKQLERKPTYRPLLLDGQGREIDEYGNVVKQEIAPVKTLAANVAASNANKKKENPYLAHRTPTTATVSADSNSKVEELVEPIVDDRLPMKCREQKSKKALQFVEAGKYIQEAAKLQEKEDRKIIAGYSSGRKSLQRTELSSDDGVEPLDHESNIDHSALLQMTEEEKRLLIIQQSVPSFVDQVVPILEWWDELFLPKHRREQRKLSKAAASELEDVKLLALSNNKTYKYVQHPLPVKPLHSDKPLTTLPTMYLTKKERKKLRKSIRQEREKNKRDQMMLGLLPAAEPKFKLNNFMKILGDQAVADPSKIELKVIQQVQKRILNHEMRNLANKLTPKERKEKKIRKLNEDLSRGCHVAVFRVTNFSCLKYRFKVDVNAQQLFLTGLVMLCPDEGLNMVVVEGGPKGIRKFIHLMSKRIKWNVEVVNKVATEEFQVVQEGDSWNYLMNVPGMSEVLQQQAAEEKEEEEQSAGGDSEGDSSTDDDENEDENDEDDQSEEAADDSLNERENFDFASRRCDLLWQGVIPKRLFSGFRFQESKSPAVARKFLESKNVAHYWDMVQHADAIVSSVSSVDDFFH